MDLSKLTLGDKIVGGCAIVLLIDLLFLPWHNIDFGPFGSESCNAMDCTNEFWGILAWLLTAVVLALLVITRLTEVELPEIPISWNQAIFYACIGVLVLLLLKLLLETDFLSYGAYPAILLGGGMCYGGFLVSQDDTAGAGGTPEAF